MRVCFISCYPPTHARLSEYANELVKALAKRPAIDEIYVLADSTADAASFESAFNGKVKVHRVWRTNNPLSIMLLIWHILKLKPDVVHFNLHFQSFGKSRLSNFSGFALIGLCRLFKLHTVTLLHNLADRIDFAKLKLKRSFINDLGIFLAMRFVFLSSRIVTPVYCYAEDIKKRCLPKKVNYIPHGTTVSDSDSNVPIDKSDKVVLMFGHMGPAKGLPTMFAAFDQISKENDEVKLVVAGESHPNYPRYLSDLKRVAPRGVEFLGYIDEADMERVFKSAAVVVLPYFTATGTSGVFHLACGYGKSIVASDLPEISELVDEGASAVLTRPGDVHDLKKAVLHMLYNEDVAEKMGWQNLQFAKRECWSSVAQKYERLYLDLMAKRKTS